MLRPRWKAKAYQARASQRSLYFQPQIETLEPRLAMSASPWSQLTRDEAVALLAGHEFVADQIVVALQSPSDSLSFTDVLAIEAARDAATVALVDGVQLLGNVVANVGSSLYTVTLKAGADLTTAIAAISNWSGVEWAAPNFVYIDSDRELTPNDPSYGTQYHHTTMQNAQAWNITQGSGIIVAVTDDGFDWDHSDLAANIWNNSDEIAGNGLDDDNNGYIDDIRGWDFSSNDNNPDQASGDDHGTHVAGIIAAVTNNGVGIAGTAGQATIMPIRFYGSGSWTSTVIFNSYKYATDNGAKIISTSYNIDGFASDPTFASAVNYAYTRGVLHFNSAGNNSELNPARGRYDQLLFVASTDSGDLKSSFSNYGRKIDIAAPGSSIYSTLPNNTYGYNSGTSMATPNAAAVAALIWAANPTWTRDQVAAQLLGTADNIDALNAAYAGLMGTGRANSYKALTQTIAPPKIQGLTEITGSSTPAINKITVQTVSRFDETTVEAAANWELRGDGADGVFNTADDVIIVLTRTTDYMIGSNEIVFTFNTLTADRYRFTAKSGASGIKDPFGTQLDGNADGAAGGDYVREFTAAGAMQVTSSTPAPNSTIAPPLTLIEINFDRAYLTSSIGLTDLTLSRGTVTAYQFPDADTVRYVVSGLTTGGSFTYTLAAGAVTDTSGGANAAYTATVMLDVTATPFSMSAIGPAHALAQSGSYVGTLTSGTDFDLFTMDLLAGQTLSLAASPSAALRVSITVTGPDATNVTISGTAAGAAALLQSIPIVTAGKYTIRIDSLNGVGGTFKFEALVNAEFEDETYGGASNGTSTAPAVISAGAWRDLGGGSSRAVVAGTFDSATATVASEGFEGGTLPASWTSSSSIANGRIVVSNSYKAAGTYALLMDTSVSGTYNLNQATWMVDLAGRTNVKLTFSEAAWGDEEDPLPASFTNSSNGDGVSFSVDGTTWYRLWTVVDQSDGVWDTYTVDLSAAAAAAGVTLTSTTRVRFQQYDDFAMTTDGRGWDQISITADGSVNVDDWYKVSLAAGESLSVAIQTTGQVNYAGLYKQSFEPITEGVGADSAIRRFVAPTAGDYLVRVTGSGTYSLVLVKNGSLDLDSNDSSATATSIGGDVRVLGTTGPATTDDDFYRVAIAAGDTLSIATATPVIGLAGASNTLDPQLDLYDSTGTLVASDLNSLDGKNASLSYQSTAGGMYTVRVRSTSGTGAYVLNVTGASTNAATNDAPFTVLSTSPTAGTTYIDVLTSITIRTTEAFDERTVNAGDLTINGIAAATVTVQSADTLTFQFAKPIRGSTVFAIAAGSLTDLQGNAFAGHTFQVNYQRNTAPTLNTSTAMVLAPVAEDTTAGTGMLIADLLATGAGGNPITDPDTSDGRGIAITAADTTQGAWTYSLDGGVTWTALGAVSTTAARLLAVDPQTRLRFIPLANYNGTLSAALTFRAWDRISGTNGGTANVGTGGGTTAFSTATGTASLTVTPVNDAPTANSASYTGTTNLTSSFTLSGSDNDAGVTQTLTYSIVSGPTHGTLTTFNPATGAVVYTPAANYFGPDSFTFRVTDDATAGGPGLASAPATITLTVNPSIVNTLIKTPTRRDHVYDATRNVLYVSTNIGTIDRFDGTTGALLGSWKVSSGTLNGLDITADGLFLYVADGTATATQGFIRKIEIDTGTVSTLSYTLGAQEGAAYDLKIGAQGVILFSTASTTTTLSANIRQIDAATDAITILRAARNQTQIARSADRNVFLLTDGTTSIGYATYDVRTATFSATTTVSTTFNEYESVLNADGTLMANETSAGIDVRNTATMGTVAGSVASLQSAGMIFDPVRSVLYVVKSSTIEARDVSSAGLPVLYSFSLGETTTASTSYANGQLSISDDGRRLFLSVASGIRMYDLGPSDQLTTRANSYDAMQDTALNVEVAAGVLGNDLDPHARTLTASLVAGPSHGTVTLNADGSFVYTPTAGYTGFDSFRYRAMVGAEAGTVANVLLRVRPTVNVAPTANDDLFYAQRATTLAASLSRNVLSNDTDSSFDKLTAELVTGPANGTLTLNADGTFIYKGSTNYVGADSFTYRALDGFGGSSIATVRINVLPIDVGAQFVVSGRRDHVIDTQRDLLYITTSSGKVERYDLKTGTLLTAWTVTSGQLNGIDISRDGQYLYIADAVTNLSQGYIRRLEIATGTITSYSYALASGESGAWDVVVGSDDRVYFSTHYAISGATDIRVIDTANGAISVVLSDYSYDSLIARGGDRSLLMFTQVGNSSGTLLLYDTKTRSTAGTTLTNQFLSDAGATINRDGTLIAIELNSNIVIYDRALKVVTTLPTLYGGMIFDPVRDILYAVNSSTSEIVAFNTQNWQEIYRRPSGSTMMTSAMFSYGMMSIGEDGRRLVVSTLSGLRAYDLGLADLPSAVNDDYVATKDVRLDVAAAQGLLANDKNPGGGALTLNVVQTTQNGVLSVAADGSFSYTPTTGFLGYDRFTYTLTNSAGVSNTATAEIFVAQVNVAPTFTKGANIRTQSFAANTFANWATSIGAGAGDLYQSLNFTLTSDNPTLFSVAPTISPTGTLSFTAAAGMYGTAEVTVVLRDNGGTADGGVDASAPQTFRITIADPPTIATIPAQVMLEDTTHYVDFMVSDPDSPLSAVTFQFVSSDTTVLPTSNLSVSNVSPGVYRLAITPQANRFGNLTVGILAGDGTDVGQTGFNLTITNVNDEPSFVKGADQVVLRTATTIKIVSGWATSLSSGTFESQTNSFVVTSDNPNLFTTQPAVSSSGQLTFTPSGRIGTAVVTVVMKDNGGTTNGGVDASAPQTFVIQVVDSLTPGLESPITVTPLAPLTINEDTSFAPVAFSVSHTSLPAENLTVTFLSSNTTLLPTAGVTLTNLGSGNWQIGGTPVAGASGTSIVTLLVSDGTVIYSHTFTLTVNSVNDVPSFTKGADQVVRSDGTAKSVSSWATAIAQGTGDTGQTLTFVVSTDNQTLFSVQPTISSSGTLTYTPAFGASGTANVTVYLRDNGGTLLGGVDASATQTFTISMTAPPQFVGITDRTVNEDNGPITIDFNVVDIDTPAAQLVVTATSSNTALLPNANLVLTTDGLGAWRLVATPVAEASGTSTITLTVTGDGTVTKTMVLTVNSVNDAPVFTKGANIVRAVDTGSFSQSGWATGIAAGGGETGQTLTFLVTNDNNALFTTQPTISSSGTLSFTLKSGVWGLATVTVSLKDTGGTANGGVDTSAAQTFTILITNPPVISSIPTQTILEDGVLVLPFTITDVDTPQSQLVVTATSNSQSIIPNANLTFTDDGNGNWVLRAQPLANASGSSNITINVSDGGPTVSRSFSLTITAVNDAPSFTKGADQSVARNATAQTITSWATAVVAGPTGESQALTFLVSTDRPDLFLVAPTINSSGTLSYTVSGIVGTATVTVRLQDNGGMANGGVDISAPQTFLINVNDVPIAPGLIDNTFDFDGKLQLAPLSAGADGGRGVVVLPDGKILVVGNNSSSITVAARYNADGTLDTTFGVGGRISIAGSSTNTVYDVELTADGKILISGERASKFWLMRLNADGSLDTSFGTNCEAFATFSSSAAGRTMAQQADGKIVVVGTSSSDFAAARFNADGTLDTTFGTAGLVLIPIGTTTDSAYDVAVQTDGKIVIVGSAFNSSTVEDYAVIRLTSSGALDTTFATGGKAILSLGAGSTAEIAKKVALQADGKIVVAGNTAGAMNVLRLNTDGTLDTTFSGDGLATQPFAIPASTDAMVIGADGKILLAGYLQSATTNLDWAFARFNADGTNDASFGTGGARVVGLGTGSDRIYAAALQSDGRIVVAGTANLGLGVELAVARLLADGSTDTSFGKAGIAVENFSFAASEFAYAAALQADGKILIAGGASIDGSTRPAIWRLNADGTLDTTFGIGGRTRHPSQTVSPTEARMLVQPDGKILATFGTSYSIVRFNADGSIDETFSGDGINTFPTTFRARSLALQADGRIFVGGAMNNGANDDFAVVRLLADGTLDTAFGNAGMVMVPMGIAADDALAMTLQADGKMVLVGTVVVGSFTQIGVARLSADGTLDTSFSGDGMLVTSILSGNHVARDVAIDRDGKIVIVGSAAGSSTTNEFFVVRLLADGAIDTSFSGDGKVTAGFASVADNAYALAIQADGQILVGGTGASSTDFVLMRFTVSGSLDTSFGANGIVSTAIGISGTDTIREVLLQPNGRIVVVGSAEDAVGYTRVSLARYFGLIGEAAGPTITAIGDVAINEGDAALSVTFTIDDTDTPTGSLSVWASTSNGVLLPDGSFTVTSLGGGSRSLALTPAADRFGTATVTVFVSDGVNVASRSFRFDVAPVNDAPSFTKGPDIVVHLGDGPQTIAAWAKTLSAGAFENGQTATFEVSADDASLFLAPPSIAADGTLTFQAGTVAGLATITVRLRDDGGTALGGADISAPQTFTIRISQTPTISTIADATTNEDGTGAIVAFTVTDVDTPSAQLTVTATSSDVDLLPNNRLTLTDLGNGQWQLTALPAADRYGSTVITVTVSDGSPITKQFTLNVTPINDVPSFTGGVDQIVVAGSGQQTVVGWARDINAGRFESQNLAFDVTVGNPELFSAPPTIDASGTLRYTLSGVLGTTTVNVVLRDDGGTTLGGVDQTAAQSFKITAVQAVIPPGSLDTTFDGDGIVNVASNVGSSDTGIEMGVQPDGKTVALAKFTKDSSGTVTYRVVRYLSDGSADTTFGVGGSVTAAANVVWNTLEVLANGSFLVAGRLSTTIYLAKYTASGVLDTTFGTGGVVTTQILVSETGETFGIAVQTDGKIVVVGSTTYSGGAQVFVGRYTAAGVVDTSLAGTGFAIQRMAQYSIGYDVALTSTGVIVVAGKGSTTPTGASTFELYTLSSSGTFLYLSYTGSGNSGAYRAVTQSDGKVVIGGVVTDALALRRVTTSGQADSTFYNGFAMTIAVPSTGAVVRGLAVQADGKILIAGGTTALAGLTARVTSTGTVDTTYGTNGIRQYNFSPTNTYFNAMKLQTDGRMLVFGQMAATTGSVGIDLLLARLNADGTADTTFDGDGYVTRNLDFAGVQAAVTIVQPDGKILVGATEGETNSPVVRRLLADGAIDTTFGTGGRVALANLTGPVNAIGLQPDGKILVADNIGRIRRLNADGTTDTTFGTAGTAFPQSFLDGSAVIGRTIVVQADGKILVGGRAFDGVNNLFSVIRLNANGSIDGTFSSGLPTSTNVGPGNDFGRVMAVQADGKILVAGETWNGTSYDFGIVRYLTNGQRDTTFDGDGIRTIKYGTGISSVYGLVVTPDGKIVVAGADATRFVSMRLLGTGALDTTYGNAGVAEVATGGTSVFLAGLLRTADGDLVAVGRDLQSASNGDVVVVRWSADGALDPSFQGGVVRTPLSNYLDTAAGLALQPDGKLVVVGSTFDATGIRQDVVVLRYLLKPQDAGAPPTISTGTPQTMLEDTLPKFFVDFSVADADTPLNSLQVSVRSGDSQIVRNSDLILSTSGNGTWNLVVWPTAQAFGTVPIIVSVFDGATRVEKSITLNVLAINDAPSFTKGTNRTVGFGQAVSVANWAQNISTGPANESSQTASFIVSASEPSLFAVQPWIDAAGTLNFTAAAGTVGRTTTVYVRLQDDGGTANGGVDRSPDQSFTVTFVNSPKITPIADITILEGTSVPPIFFSVSDSDTPLTSVTVTRSVGTGSAVTASQVVLTDLGGGNWQAVVTPGNDAFGTSRISISASDGLATSVLTFQLDIVDVNDAPSFVKGLDQYVAASAGAQTEANWAKVVSAGPSEGTSGITFEVTVDRSELFTVLPTIAADGTLSYTPDASKTGTAVVTVTLRDGNGVANGGSDVSAPQTFVIRTLTFDPIAGDFDPTFSTDGLAEFYGTYGSLDLIRDTVVQADGKILVTGIFAPSATASRSFVARYNTDGSLDTTFGDAGFKTIDRSSSTDTVYAMKLDASGRIYVAHSTLNRYSIIRLLADGSYDLSYSEDGVATSTSNFSSGSVSLAIQTDGKVVLVGRVANGLTAIRFNTDGTIDSAFNGGGLFVITLGSSVTAVNDVAIQSDGSIVIVGSTSVNLNQAALVARLTSTGARDNSFGSGGYAAISWGGSVTSSYFTSVAIDAQRRIVAGAYVAGDFGLARFNADGTFDTTFDGDGTVVTTATGNNTLRKLIIRADGTIVAAGDTDGSAMMVARYLDDGRLDTTLSGDGLASFDFGPNNTDIGYSLALQADGKIIVVGQTNTATDAEAILFRLTADGALDTSFSGDGIVTFGGGGASQTFNAAIRQADGKLLVTGLLNQPSGGSLIVRPTITRYLADGSLDASFGNGGTVVLTMITGSLRLALQPDGKFIVSSSSSILRYNTDGTRDLNFGNSGSATSAGMTITSLTMLADGKFLIAGYTSTHAGLARYNADGTLDFTFDVDGIAIYNIAPTDAFLSAAVRSDGKIVVLGLATATSNSYFVGRILTDGSLDTTFGGGTGLTTLALSPAFTPTKIALQPNGRIVVVGTQTFTSSAADWTIVRLLDDGTLDDSFGTGGVVNYVPSGAADTLTDFVVQADGGIVVVGSSAQFNFGDSIAVGFLPSGRLDPTFGHSGLLTLGFGKGDSAAAVMIDADGKIVIVGNFDDGIKQAGYIVRLRNEAEVAPTVTGIYARGVGSGSANWNASFLAYLAANNLGDASLGYMLSTGGTQLKTLSWSNVNTISIRFNEELTISQGDLSVIGAANGPAVPAITGFSWNSATHTGTWTFAAALPRGKFLLHLKGTLLDTVGNGLDGEWNVSSSTASGNGTAGGDFNFRFNVLPGDFDGNNGVTITEVLQARNRAGKGTASVGYAYREDIDGNGNITITEVLQSRNRTATSITGLNEPVAPGSTPQSPLELAPLVPGEEDGLYVSPYAALAEAELAPIVEEAIARWEASGLVPQDFDWSKLRFAITDLGPAYLGLGNPDGAILLDDDGAGWGWFVDSSPSEDGEFASSTTDAAAAAHMDLLTVVMHEIGHALGYPTGSAQDTPAAALMSEFLGVGTRRTPGLAQPESLPESDLAPADLLAVGGFDADLAGPSLTRLSAAVAPSLQDYAIYALSSFTDANRALSEQVDESAKGRVNKTRRTAAS
jgi:uncharacterized delta-60 repeat protein